MGRPVLTLPGYYQVIFQFTNSLDPAANWRNVWDISSPGGAPANDNDPLIAALKGFHRANLHGQCLIEKITLRNWSQGPQPFANRANLWEIPQTSNNTGLKASASPNGYGAQDNASAMAGEVVLFAKRNSQGPFRGTSLFLRGLLDPLDAIAFAGGTWIPTASPNVTPATFQAIVTAHLGTYLNVPTSQPSLVVVHVGNHYAGPPIPTAMASLTYIRFSTNKQTRKNKK